jgi:hypothetical protein
MYINVWLLLLTLSISPDRVFLNFPTEPITAHYYHAKQVTMMPDLHNI